MVTAVAAPGGGNATGAVPSVFGWAGDFDGCGYYRIALPIHALRMCGHRVDASSDIPLDGGNWDVIIGQRVVRDDSSAVWRQLARSGRRLVYEVDDDLWHIPEHNPARGVYDGAARERAAENVAEAHMVTCTTDALADVLRAWNPNVHVVPNYIDQALLQVHRVRRPRLTIGWAGGNTHRQDLRPASRAVRKILAKRSTLDLHIIGADYLRVLGDRGRFSAWKRPTTDYYGLIDFDIGIAPLEQTEFNESKSPIKALEYAALGIPVIASNVGPYKRFVRHGVTGFLCDTERDWSDALRELTGDADLRQQMGAAAREQAAEWTIQGHAHEWAQTINQPTGVPA